MAPRRLFAPCPRPPRPCPRLVLFPLVLLYRGSAVAIYYLVLFGQELMRASANVAWTWRGSRGKGSSTSFFALSLTPFVLCTFPHPIIRLLACYLVSCCARQCVSGPRLHSASPRPRLRLPSPLCSSGVARSRSTLSRSSLLSPLPAVSGHLSATRRTYPSR